MWVCICAVVFVHASLGLEGVRDCACVCVPAYVCVAFLHAQTYTHTNTHGQLRLCTAADPQRGVLGAA